MTATPDPIDGSITDPDQALNAMTRIATFGLAAGGLSGGDLTRLLRVIQWMNAHLTTGGPLPTPWAGRPDARDDDPPVADVRLPGDPAAAQRRAGKTPTAADREQSRTLLYAEAGTAAREVTAAHRPGRPYRPDHPRYCLRCGQPYPCHPVILAAAWFDAQARWLPAAHLVAGHRAMLVNAVAIAWGVSRPADSDVHGCADCVCTCTEPGCKPGVSHYAAHGRLCDGHQAALTAAANFLHLENALRAMPS